MCPCPATQESAPSSMTMEVLTERERDLVAQLDISYQMKYAKRAETDPTLIYYLGDRFEYSRTWSAHSGRIPTFRTGGSRFLHRQSLCFLTGKDKLSALGWPVRADIAAQMGCKVLPSMDSKRAHFLAGNSMHLTVSSIVLLLGLVCFKKKSD